MATKPSIVVSLLTQDNDYQVEQAASADGFDALTGAVGWVTWHELGELALDLAEEEEDSLRADQVHLLVTQLQDRFPDIDL